MIFIVVGLSSRIIMNEIFARLCRLNRKLILKILIICYVYPPEVAPAGIMVRELADDLSAKGHKVTVQTGWPNHPKGKLYPGYKMKWRPKRTRWPARSPASGDVDSRQNFIAQTVRCVYVVCGQFVY